MTNGKRSTVRRVRGHGPNGGKYEAVREMEVNYTKWRKIKPNANMKKWMTERTLKVKRSEIRRKD